MLYINRLIYFISTLCFIAAFQVVYADPRVDLSDKSYAFNVPTLKTSYFQLNKQGSTKLDKSGMPYHGQSDKYTIQAYFTSRNTAFFVIDPWNNMPSSFLNSYYGKITEKYILPLIREAAEKKFPIFIFTNNCAAFVSTPYSCSISKNFLALAKKYKNVRIVFWQDKNSIENFSNNLKEMGISKIIYTGFASNMCILERPTGMFHMAENGFSLYFIPKASAAMETTNTWDSGEIHRVTSMLISQTLAPLIKYHDIFFALKDKG